MGRAVVNKSLSIARGFCVKPEFFVGSRCGEKSAQACLWNSQDREPDRAIQHVFLEVQFCSVRNCLLLGSEDFPREILSSNPESLKALCNPRTHLTQKGYP